MIPLKIISIKEAENLGFTKKIKKKSGGGTITIGQIVRGGDGKPTRVIESYKVIENKKHLIFMSEERKEELKKANNFTQYVSQFNKISKDLNG